MTEAAHAPPAAVAIGVLRLSDREAWRLRVLDAVDASRGRIGAASAHLGVSLRTLQRWRAELGLPRGAAGRPAGAGTQAMRNSDTRVMVTHALDNVAVCDGSWPEAPRCYDTSVAVACGRDGEKVTNSGPRE